MSGFTVQHITFEDFSHNSKHAVSTVIHELIIKDDIRRGMFSLFDWGGMGFEKDITFGLSTGGDSPKYFFMTVRPDGSFFFSEQQLNLFELNEYSVCVQIFSDNRRAEGMIKYSDDDILAICGTDIFTLPEYMGLSTELKSGNTALLRFGLQISASTINISQNHSDTTLLSIAFWYSISDKMLFKSVS